MEGFYLVMNDIQDVTGWHNETNHLTFKLKQIPLNALLCSIYISI